MPTIQTKFRVDGVLTDPTSIVLSDSGATYGVQRTDTDALVVAAGTAMVKTSTGVYAYTFSDPAYGLTYRYSIKAVYDGETFYTSGTVDGAASAISELTSSIYDLVPQIQPYVPNCPDNVVKQGLRKVLRDFCVATDYWTETLTDFLSVDGQDEYDLSSAYEADIQSVLEVKYDTVVQDPNTYTVTTNGVLVFDTAPTETGKVIAVKVTLAPRSAVYVVPTWLYNRMGDGLVAGVLAHLMLMVKKPWGDRDESQRWADDYRMWVNNAKTERVMGRIGGNRKVEFRSFV